MSMTPLIDTAPFERLDFAAFSYEEGPQVLMASIYIDAGTTPDSQARFVVRLQIVNLNDGRGERSYWVEYIKDGDFLVLDNACKKTTAKLTHLVNEHKLRAWLDAVIAREVAKW